MVLVRASEKEKTRASSWFEEKVNFFENLIFNQFYDSLSYFLNGIHHINLVKIEGMKYFFKS